MPFTHRITNEFTPKRIQAICKLISNRSLKKEEAADYLQPKVLRDKTRPINKLINFAISAELIQENNNELINCKLKKHEVMDKAFFRYYIASKVFDDPELVFCRFTGWYLARGDKVYTDSDDDLVSEFDKEINLSGNLNIYNKTNIKGWRTWAEFLGIGFIHNGILIPNMSVRLLDILKNNEIETEKRINFRSFLNKINSISPEFDGGSIYENNKGAAKIKEKSISLGLSNGLRFLDSQGLINLEYIDDSTDIWNLSYPSEKISDITIKDVIFNEQKIIK